MNVPCGHNSYLVQLEVVGSIGAHCSALVVKIATETQSHVLPLLIIGIKETADIFHLSTGLVPECRCGTCVETRLFLMSLKKNFGLNIFQNKQ